MGWSTLHKPSHTTTKEWVKSNYNSENYEVLDVAAKLTEVYAAVKDKKTGKVFALILLIRHGRGYHNFSYKSMDEFCGPGGSGCPKKILELLSPLTDENDPDGWALKWRQRCWEQIYTASNAKGKDYLITPEEVTFTNGSSYNCFRKLKTRRGTYLGVWLNEQGELQESNGVYKFNPKRYNYCPCTKEMALEGLGNIEKGRKEKL